MSSWCQVAGLNKGSGLIRKIDRKMNLLPDLIPGLLQADLPSVSSTFIQDLRHFHPCRRRCRDHKFGLGFGVVMIIVVIIYLQLGFMKTLRWICVGVLSTPPHPNLASWYTLTLSSSSMLQSMLQPIVIGHYRFHFKWPCHSPLSLLRRVQSKRSRITSSSQLLHIGCHLHQWRFETQFWSKIVPHECLTNQT